MKCPKCTSDIRDDSSKCPYCNNHISRKKKEELKVIIGYPNKITNTENLDTEEIKINPIPLKVKTPKAPPTIPVIKEEKLPRPEDIKEEYKRSNIESTVNIITSSLILLLNIILLFNIVNKLEAKTPEETNLPTNKENEVIKLSSLGSWYTSNNGLYVFGENNSFYWYDYYKELNDNYYSGTYTYNIGDKALKEMGYNKEEFENTYEDIKIENVYSIKLNVNKYIYFGEDKSDDILEENEVWWFLLLIRDDGSAQAYNKTLDLRYELKPANK